MSHGGRHTRSAGHVMAWKDLVNTAGGPHSPSAGRYPTTTG